MRKNNLYGNLPIQRLRGFSVVAVIFFHSKQNYFPNGYLGVDIFFVISGYLLAEKILSLRTSPKKFLIPYLNNRLRRIFPSLILMSFYILPFLTLIYPFGASTFKSIRVLLSVFTFSSNIVVAELVGNYFAGSPNAFTHLWSLGIELQFYILFPALLILINAISWRIAPTFEYAILTGLALISFVYEQISFPSSYYSLLPNIWKFIIGIFAYTLKSRFSLFSKLGNCLFFLMFCLVLAPGINLSEFRMFIPVMAAIILSQEIKVSAGRKLNILLKNFGDLSYQLYLVHYPILMMIKYSSFAMLQSETIRALLTISALPIIYMLSKVIYIQETHIRNFFLIRQYIVVLLIFSILISAPAVISSRMTYSPKFAGDVVENCDANNLVDNPCEFNYGGKDVILIGDSHATAFVEVLRRAASESKSRLFVWTQNGCKYVNVSLLSNSQMKMYNEINECRKRNTSFEKFLLEHKSSLVFISWRPQSCKDDNYFLGLCGNDFRSLIFKSVQTLAERVQTLYVIGPAPEFENDRLLADRGLIQKSIDYPERYGKSELKERPMLDEIFLSSQEIFPYKYISLFSNLCDSNYVNCLFRNGKNYVYKDNNHISLWGSMLFFPIFQELLIQQD